MDELGRIFAHRSPWIGEIHHSSFLHGKAIVMAGEIKIINGTLIRISNNTGHYKTRERHMKQFLKALEEKGINIRKIEIEITH